MCSPGDVECDGECRYIIGGWKGSKKLPKLDGDGALRITLQFTVTTERNRIILRFFYIIFSSKIVCKLDIDIHYRPLFGRTLFGRPL